MAKGKRAGKVTQKDMVREALGEKGWKVPTVELQTCIKDKHGVELPINIISNYKSQIKKAEGLGAARPAAAPGRKAAAGLNLADIEAVKGLVKRLGSEQVQQLAAMFE